uniref:Uncharacterized protein n=1 Tax=Anguilla anguilla TaxID=7936 RepID=A0A0E9TGJ4_ANGAN
MEVRSRKQQ